MAYHEVQTPYVSTFEVAQAYPDERDEDIILAAIRLVSGYIDTFLGFKLARELGAPLVDWREDGSGTEYLMLSQPVNGFTVAQLEALDDSLTDELYVRSYPLNALYTTYLAKRMGKFMAGMGNYVLPDVRMGMFVVDWDETTGEGNAPQHTLPEDIRKLALAMAIATLKNGGVMTDDAETAGSIASETTSSYSISYAQDKNKAEKAISSVPTGTGILAKYKIYPVV